jgi:Ca2+-binding RTX toxin-like protein
MRRRLLGLVPLAIPLACVAALTASTTVAPSLAGRGTRALTANELKPPPCAALHLTRVITGAGSISGGREGELILGSPGNDRIRGGGGNDCLVGGAGDDMLIGNGGFDVCIGGPGNDTFRNCSVVIP